MTSSIKTSVLVKTDPDSDTIQNAVDVCETRLREALVELGIAVVDGNFEQHVQFHAADGPLHERTGARATVTLRWIANASKGATDE